MPMDVCLYVCEYERTECREHKMLNTLALHGYLYKDHIQTVNTRWTNIQQKVKLSWMRSYAHAFWVHSLRLRFCVANTAPSPIQWLQRFVYSNAIPFVITVIDFNERMRNSKMRVHLFSHTLANGTKTTEKYPCKPNITHKKRKLFVCKIAY